MGTSKKIGWGVSSKEESLFQSFLNPNTAGIAEKKDFSIYLPSILFSSLIK